MEEPLTVAAIFRDPFNILAISEVLKVVAAVGWSVNYIGMVHRAWKDQIPSIGILPLCCDIGWEFVYAWMFPDFSSHWQGVVRVWFFLHSAVLLVTLKVSPNDWANTPLAHRHIVFIYIFVTLVFGAGQYALAAEIGPALGFHWGGALCQFLSSSCGIAQLLSRGHTRGASYLIW
jgi:paspaline synthase